jgi:hypothetical protein
VVLQRVLQFGHAVELALVAVRDRLGHVVVIDQQLRQLAQALRDGIEHAGTGGELRLLRDVGDLRAGLTPDDAVVECRIACEDFQQAGLAGAVAADQRQPLARFDHQCSVVQQWQVAEGKAGIVEGDQRHGGRRAGRFGGGRAVYALPRR